MRVVPVLSLDGVEARRFSALMPGLVQDLGVRVTLAGATPANAVHRVTSGGVYALSVAAGAPAAARVEALRRAITSASGDARLLAEAQLAAALYSRMQQSDANRLFALEAHTSIQDVLEVLTGKELEVETVNGTPVSLQPGLYVIDVARDSLTPLPLNGDGSRVPYLARLAGHHGMPSGRVLRILTRRQTIPSFFGGETSRSEQEQLLFFWLGVPPDDYLDLVY